MAGSPVGRPQGEVLGEVPDWCGAGPRWQDHVHSGHQLLEQAIQLYNTPGRLAQGGMHLSEAVRMGIWPQFDLSRLVSAQDKRQLIWALANRLREAMALLSAPLFRVWRVPRPERRELLRPENHGSWVWWIARPTPVPPHNVSHYFPRGTLFPYRLGS